MSWKDWVVMTYQFVGGLCMFLGGVSNDCIYDGVMQCDMPNLRPLKIWAGFVGCLVIYLITDMGNRAAKKKRMLKLKKSNTRFKYLKKLKKKRSDRNEIKRN